MRPLDADPPPAHTPAPTVTASGSLHVAHASDLGNVQRLLDTAGSMTLTFEERLQRLNSAYSFCITCYAERLPTFADTPPPIPGRTRQAARALQAALQAVAQHLLSCYDNLPSASPQAVARPLWQALQCLSRHLLISSLISSPPTPTIWRQLHQAYNLARQYGVTRETPSGNASLQDVYYATALLGCAQPASFTAQEIAFLDSYLERFSNQIDSNKDKPTESPVMFWIDPSRDAPPTPYTRKPPPPETPIRYFSCSRLANLLTTQLVAIEAGTPSERLNLPDFANTPAGRGVLGRLIDLWGHPKKRRFPRRRQNYRCDLCVGFDNVFRLFRDASPAPDTSAWMITNESPDGYSAMHASGKTGPISVGDIAALRTETGAHWQLCIIRWVLSENQEHIEIGLQILSARAFAAEVALPQASGARTRHPALVLPPAAALRPDEAMVLPAGSLARHKKNLVLLVEHDNIEVREIDAGSLDERNGIIELFSITPRPQVNASTLATL